MAGRPPLQSSSISQLTSQPETVIRPAVGMQFRNFIPRTMCCTCRPEFSSVTTHWTSSPAIFDRRIQTMFIACASGGAGAPAVSQVTMRLKGTPAFPRGLGGPAASNGHRGDQRQPEASRRGARDLEDRRGCNEASESNGQCSPLFARAGLCALRWVTGCRRPQLNRSHADWRDTSNAAPI
jgi:hypothetical protein